MAQLPNTPATDGEWHFENWRSGFVQGVRVLRRLADIQTPYQHLEIVEVDPFGRALILDHALQTTEWDEFMYHEMLVHVPLMTHPNPRRVLIIGGGDGGSLRRALQHPVDQAVQCELDGQVIEACREYLPSISAGAYDHPRAHVVVGDGVEFMKQNPGGFDVVVVDSTDPVGQAARLFQAPFYQDVFNSLSEDGLMVAQSNSPLLMPDELRAQVAELSQVFPVVRTYLGSVMGYPGVLWSYSIGSKRHDPAAVQPEAVAARLVSASIATRYYTPQVHQAAFALPRFVAETLA